MEFNPTLPDFSNVSEAKYTIHTFVALNLLEVPRFRSDWTINPKCILICHVHDRFLASVFVICAKQYMFF